MQSLSNKRHDQTTSDSFATSLGGRLSLRLPTEQSQLSFSKNAADELFEMKMKLHHHEKLSESKYQEHDSSSTLSTGQSHNEAAASEKSNFQVQNVPFQTGFLETCKKKREDCVRPYLPYVNEDHIGHQVQTEHQSRPLDCMSYPFAGPYFGRIASAYEPNGFAYPQMMGVAPARPVLPIDCTEGIIPIYVNAKQYHAILRRRKTRAKLEAQNKVTKSRKPYLHESRHRHALKRARGSGGRFLTKNDAQEPNPTAQKFDKGLVLSEPEAQHSENSSWGGSTPSNSDVSCIFNSDDIFQPPDLGVSIDSMTAIPDDRLALAVNNRYAQIGT